MSEVEILERYIRSEFKTKSDFAGYIGMTRLVSIN